MELTREDGQLVIYGDHEDWEEVADTREIIDQSRWSTLETAVFHHKLSDKYYQMSWLHGSTESQEESPFEYDDPEPIEVEKRIVEVEQWIEKEKQNEDS